MSDVLSEVILPRPFSKQTIFWVVAGIGAGLGAAWFLSTERGRPLRGKLLALLAREVGVLTLSTVQQMDSMENEGGLSPAHGLEPLTPSSPTHDDIRSSDMGAIIDKVKAKAKQVHGIITGDKTLEREGRLDELKGQVKGVVDKVEDAADAVKPAVLKV